MTAFSLTIPLITTKRLFKNKLFVVGGLLFLLIALVSLFGAENNLKVYFFIAGLIFLWIGTLFKDYSRIGTINWDVDKIVIEDIAEIKIYYIRDVENIKINLTGVEGEMYSIKTVAIIVTLQGRKTGQPVQVSVSNTSGPIGFPNWLKVVYERQ